MRAGKGRGLCAETSEMQLCQVLTLLAFIGVISQALLNSFECHAQF